MEEPVEEKKEPVVFKIVISTLVLLLIIGVIGGTIKKAVDFATANRNQEEKIIEP